jgi:hypothetical protein
VKHVALLFFVAFALGTAAAADAPTGVQAYPCANGTTSYVTKTGLTSCKVSRETAFGEARVPEGSTISLWDGKPSFVFLSRDTGIEGHTCLNGLWQKS